MGLDGEPRIFEEKPVLLPVPAGTHVGPVGRAAFNKGNYFHSDARVTLASVHSGAQLPALRLAESPGALLVCGRDVVCLYH